MADKVIELLRLMEKFGVKPGKIIGAGDKKVTPIKKPILTKQLNRDYIDQDVKDGKIGTNTVKNEIEDVASLFFQKKLNDVEVNNLLNNLTYLDNALNPTNVVDLATKKPIVGEGLETLKEAEGLIAPPTTTVGRIQSKLNEAKRGLQDISGEPDLADLIKGAGKEQLSYSKLHNEGLVRAVARSILYEDIKAGKIKGMTLEQLGSAKDPIQDFRKIYGENALEQLDSLTPEFNQMYTPQEGATLARKKFTLTPDETRLPGSQTYEELEKIKKGEEVKPEGIVIPFKKKITEPEEFADGGITRTKFASGGKGKKVLDIINQANKKLKGKKSMETVNPKTGEVTVPDEFVTTAEEPRTLGGLPIDERSANISDEIDKLRASGINSLENEKKLNRLSLEFVDSLDPGRQKKALDYRRKSLDTENKLIIKAEEEGLDFDTYEKLRQGLYGLGKQKTLNFIKTGKVDLEPLKPVTTFKETQNRFKTAAKAADEIFPNYDQPKTAASELAEVMAEQKYGKVFDDLSGDKQQELYEEAYNYITSVNKLPKRAPENMPTPPVAKENKPIEGGFSFNDPDIKAQMEEAMKEAKKRGDEMRAMGLDPASGRDYDKYIEIKTKSGDKDFNKYFDDLEIKTKFKGVISDDLLNQILIDDNPQRKAEVIATIEQGLTMQEKGMDPQEIVNILKNTTRTKQAKGGSVGLNYLMGF